MQLGNTLNIGKDLPSPVHYSVWSSSILKPTRSHAGLDWAGPPGQFPLRARAWASFRPRAEADHQPCVPTAPAAAPTCATCLLASTHSTCSSRPCAPPCALPVALIRSTLRQSLACLLLSLATQYHCHHSCALLHFARMMFFMTKSPPRSATSPSPSRA
jgi:hypothetical protein